MNLRWHCSRKPRRTRCMLSFTIPQEEKRNAGGGVMGEVRLFRSIRGSHGECRVRRGSVRSALRQRCRCFGEGRHAAQLVRYVRSQIAPESRVLVAAAVHDRAHFIPAPPTHRAPTIREHDALARSATYPPPRSIDVVVQSKTARNWAPSHRAGRLCPDESRW